MLTTSADPGSPEANERRTWHGFLALICTRSQEGWQSLRHRSIQWLITKWFELWFCSMPILPRPTRASRQAAWSLCHLLNCYDVSLVGSGFPLSNWWTSWGRTMLKTADQQRGIMRILKVSSKTYKGQKSFRDGGCVCDDQERDHKGFQSGRIVHRDIHTERPAWRTKRPILTKERWRDYRMPMLMRKRWPSTRTVPG